MPVAAAKAQERRTEIIELLDRWPTETGDGPVSPLSAGPGYIHVGAVLGSQRSRLLATQAGDLELKIPKLRKGSFLPSVIELLRCIERAPHSVGQVTSMAMVIASGVTSDGNREILGCDVGDSETDAFWQQFFASLRDRGLCGVRIVRLATRMFRLVEAR